MQNLDKYIKVSTNSGSSRTNVISDSGKPISYDNKGLSESHIILTNTSANAAPVIKGITNQKMIFHTLIKQLKTNDFALKIC